MADTKKMLTIAGGVAGISYGLSLLYNRFFPSGIAKGVVSFSALEVNANVGQNLAQGIDTSLAGTIFKYLGISQGVTGGILGQLITIFLMSVFLVYVGNWFSSTFKVGKTPNMRFVIGLTVTSLALGAVVGSISIGLGALGGLVALGIYFLIVAGVYNLARTYLIKQLPSFE